MELRQVYRAVAVWSDNKSMDVEQPNKSYSSLNEAREAVARHKHNIPAIPMETDNTFRVVEYRIFSRYVSDWETVEVRLDVKGA